MNTLQQIAAEGLKHTEANVLILGQSDNDVFFCLPLWGCESDAAAQIMAARMAICWADKNGCCDVQVVAVYRDDDENNQ